MIKEFLIKIKYDTDSDEIISMTSKPIVKEKKEIIKNISCDIELNKNSLLLSENIYSKLGITKNYYIYIGYISINNTILPYVSFSKDKKDGYNQISKDNSVIFKGSRYNDLNLIGTQFNIEKHEHFLMLSPISSNIIKNKLNNLQIFKFNF